MAGLGELERRVMDLLWESAEPLTANELRDRIGDGALAVTTVLTVLGRLERKHFVTRDRGTRPHLYSALATRADHLAELMHEALASASDRDATLARFIGQVSPREAETLRSLLGAPPVE